jgi:hypothetical protein
VYDTAGAAFGVYSDADDHVSSFGKLTINTNGKFADLTQARAAGFLEGVLTAPRIIQHYDNIIAWLLGSFPGQSTLPSQYVQWFTAQDRFMRSQVGSVQALG